MNNWERLGFKNMEECRQHVLRFIKVSEKFIANRGYGTGKILDGNLNVLLELKGDKIKSKKNLIQA